MLKILTNTLNTHINNYRYIKLFTQVFISLDQSDFIFNRTFISCKESLSFKFF